MFQLNAIVKCTITYSIILNLISYHLNQYKLFFLIKKKLIVITEETFESNINQKFSFLLGFH